MKIIILVFLLLMSSFTLYADAAHRFPPNQDFPTTFIQLNVVDENGQFIGPVLIQVKGFYENNPIEDYTLTITEPNQNLTVPWSKEFRPPGFTVELIATKENYIDSEPFSFTVTEDTPIEGLLFQHTFVHYIIPYRVTFEWKCLY